MTMTRPIRGSLARSDEGNALVEFGLTLPVILALVVGAYDYGSAYVENLRLVGAARAGAQEAMFEPTDWQNTGRMERAALEDHAGYALTDAQIASYPVTASANPYCACPDGTVVGCSTLCSGVAPYRMVELTLSTNHNVVLPYPWVTSGSIGLSQDATVRVR
jgi:Flp pilus assembly protein TadG